MPRLQVQGANWVVLSLHGALRVKHSALAGDCMPCNGALQTGSVQSAQGARPVRSRYF